MQCAHIMIADADPISASYLQTMLHYVGYHFTTLAGSGDEVLLRVDQLSVGGLCPDVLITEVELPGAMDGIELAIRVNQRYGIQAILLTGCLSPAVHARAASIQSVQLLAKPPQPGQLARCIHTALEQCQVHSTSTGHTGP